MKTLAYRTSRWIVLVLLLAGGCNRPAPVAMKVEEETKPPESSHGPTLAELLGKPRKELATEAEELQKRIATQEQARHEGKRRHSLMPDLRLPLAIPVWREARFRSEAGISLPPYVPEGVQDAVLAIHVARFGDQEAAKILLPSDDAAAAKQVEAFKLEKNYPLEWTRLVALKLHAAQLELATGEPLAAADLGRLHKQVREALDAKAAQGPLGAALLPRGRVVLERAAAAWGKEDRKDRVGPIEETLKEWGPVPAPQLPLQIGATRAEVNRLFRSTSTGSVLAALAIPRTLDLLTLPFPTEGITAAVAALDPGDRLREIILTYAPRASDYDFRPIHLGVYVEDLGVPGVEGPKMKNLGSRSWPLGDLTCDVTVLNRGSLVGGIVRFHPSKPAEAKKDLPREYGALHLDRSFEQNRLAVVPEVRQPSITVKSARYFERVPNLVPALRTQSLTLAAVKEHEQLFDRATYRYSLPDGGTLPFHEIMGLLWTTYGLGRIEEAGKDETAGFAVFWEDPKTRLSLILSFDLANIQFEIVNRIDDKNVAEREKAALAFDAAERKARLTSGKPTRRLPRFVEQVELGMGKAQIEELLGQIQGVNLRWLTTGLLASYDTIDPPQTAAYGPKQIFVRFGTNNRAVEMRGRYIDGPAAKQRTQGLRQLIDQISRQAGAPEPIPTSWPKLWDDLPYRGVVPTPIHLRWKDDSTLVTCQYDPFGLELLVRDCPLEYEEGLPLGPARCLTGGPERRLQLSMPREEVLQKMNIKQPQMQGEVLVIPTREELYDFYYLWFDGNQRVSRIRAQHRQRPDPAKLKDALNAAWRSELQRQEITSLGWYRRFDVDDKKVDQGLTWHDDVTRLRIFWEQSGATPARVFTEWKDMSQP